MRFPLALLLVGLLAGAGCVGPADPSVPFNEAPFRGFTGSGSARITGHAFVTKYDGGTVTANDVEVDLTPVTPYTQDRFDLAHGMGGAPPPDPRLAAYVRTAQTDFFGNFTFHRIPPGSYFLSCWIAWRQPSKFQANSSLQMDKQVFARVTVAPESEAHAVLTNPQ